MARMKTVLLLQASLLLAQVCPPNENAQDPVNPVVDCLGKVVQPGKTLVVEKKFENLARGINQIIPEPKMPGVGTSEFQENVLYVTTGLYENQINPAAEVHKCMINEKTCQLWFSLDSNLPGARAVNYESWQHGGLRGIAFHSHFQQNGIFYTSHIENRASSPSGIEYLSDVPNPAPVVSMVTEWKYNLNGTFVISRDLIKVGVPTYDHIIKQIIWRGDHLFIAHGDGGGASSITVDTQGVKYALGKILRLKPLFGPDWNPAKGANGKPYSTIGNPIFRGLGALPELFAMGFRDPHHMSFDNEGNLYAASFGKGNVEEINLVKPGKNYGGSLRDGTFVSRESSSLWYGITSLSPSETQTYEYPAAQWGHTGTKGEAFGEQAGAGGFPIQNGSPLSSIYHSTDFPFSGKVWYFSIEEMKSAITNRPANLSTLTQATAYRAGIYDKLKGTFANNLKATFNVSSGRLDVRFGYGPTKELYISSQSKGAVYLVTNSKPGYVEKNYFSVALPCKIEAEEMLGTQHITEDADGTAGKDGIPDILNACRVICQHRQGCLGFSFNVSNVCTFFRSASCSPLQESNNSLSQVSEGSRDRFQCIDPMYKAREGDCAAASKIREVSVGAKRDCEELCACDQSCRGFSFNPNTGTCISRSLSCLSTSPNNGFSFFEKQGARFIEKPLNESRSPAINSAHKYGNASKGCEVLRIPPGFCKACTFRANSFYGKKEMLEIESQLVNSPGSGTTCNDFYPLIETYKFDGPAGYYENSDNVFNMVSAKCIDKLKEYVELNPCDNDRRQYLNVIMSFAAKDTVDIGSSDVQAYYDAVESWDYVAYSMCEACCDCIDFGSDKLATDPKTQLKIERGNCYAHPKYDICAVYPNLKHVGAPGEEVPASAVQICPILDSFNVNHDTPSVYLTIRFNFLQLGYPQIPPFLESMINALQCSDPAVYRQCFDVECSQGRIKSLPTPSPTYAPVSIPEGSYFRIPGEDCSGGNLEVLFEVPIEICKMKCLEKPDCVGFSFKDNLSGCYLKSVANCADNRANNGFVYYAQIPQYTQKIGDCPSSQVFHDGGNFLPIPASATLMQCEGYCAAVSGCVGFSFSSQAARTCILRSSPCNQPEGIQNGTYTFYEKQL